MQQNSCKTKIVTIENAILIPEIIKYLKKGKHVSLRLTGYSMRPILENKRDVAVFVQAESYSVGDVVLAQLTENKYVVHRIISINNNKVTLRGDGNIMCENCLIEDIKAVAIGFYRKGRSHMLSTQSIKWRLYSKIWTSLFPIRKLLLLCYKVKMEIGEKLSFSPCK
ncbi:S24/S26 family peptidase [Prevotella sp. A2931]|uniref:S24/S26 family peptidase n=1 Tax=Prevotella illustrans TaxID=2800387 RepID=A0ABS3M3I6_9BACT|nr:MULTISPECIES: S24/S26 family peptidase [Prevotella]MBO1362747.1 S24/S26 family peptidase [Prevotella illustrans]PTL25742.1 peptidase S41 [Prevotella sp. oral taxon 820]